MRRISGIVLLSMTVAVASAQVDQIDPKKQQLYIMPAVIVDGDTMGYKYLPEVNVYGKFKGDKEQMDRITRNVIKAYPYARLTAETLREMDAQLARISNKKERKRYINWAEDQMKAAFEKDLKKLTYSQGRMLIKLVNRETGKTSYELVRELKGGFSAFMWQGVAKLFGANLKSEFDAKSEDLYVELIVKRIERGELPVAYIERRSLVKAD
jgi:hypothetical protein